MVTYLAEQYESESAMKSTMYTYPLTSTTILLLMKVHHIL